MVTTASDALETWARDPRVLRRAQEAAVPAGTVLLREGRTADAAYVVLAGVARLEQQGRTLCELGPGSVVGEVCLLDGGRSPMTVTATSHLEVAVITRRAFCTAMAEHPDLLARLFHQLAARVRAGLPAYEWGTVSV